MSESQDIPGMAKALKLWAQEKACKKPCGHDTVDGPGYDKCGALITCVTCGKAVRDTCILCLYDITKEEWLSILDSVLELVREKLSITCPEHISLANLHM